MNQILFFIILLIMLFFLLIEITVNMVRDISVDKRFSKYSLDTIYNDEKSIFEILSVFFKKILKKISSILKKSYIMSNYSKRYEKYISFDKKNIVESIDYVTFKVIISILVAILYIISAILRMNFSVIILFITMLIAFFSVDIYFYIDYKKRIKKIENDLLNAIIVMNNGFKSGMNIIQAINIVKDELNGAISVEFKKISEDISYGLTLETAFDRFYERIGTEEAKYIASSLSLLNETGGNIVKIFDAIEKTFYDKKKIKDEMNSLISSSLFMFRVLVMLPIVLIILIFTLSPNYFSILFSNIIGRIILILILALYIMYIVVIKKIMKVDMND